ncbi:CLUMA_CG005786, isoform A [Clunio marinus]|uniref:CLUMA_CG005786, isoform A n=1 Tax=Clunio marinus TaxID=568069 RepID=A0A1J1HVZ1_9DIPT|nr:CLUMA_CG005786, isoform A [Clunio marinus]
MSTHENMKVINCVLKAFEGNFHHDVDVECGLMCRLDDHNLIDMIEICRDLKKTPSYVKFKVSRNLHLDVTEKAFKAYRSLSLFKMIVIKPSKIMKNIPE